jgi:N6-adenosine-specific RNA methylase IME4
MSNKDILPATRDAAMLFLDRLSMSLDLEKFDSFEAVDFISKAAAGIQSTWKNTKDVSDKAGAVWVKAEVKLAEALGARPETRGKVKSAELALLKPTLKAIGLPGDAGKKRSARAQKLKELPQSVRADAINALSESGKGVSPNAVLAWARQKTKVEHRHEVAASAFSEDGPFGTVVTDPPWKMSKIDRDVRPNQDVFDYPVMSEDEIQALWEREIADRLEDDCHLFMWTTQKHLPVAINLCGLIGFKYVLTMVWHKPGGFQPIGLPQYNCEFIVYARKGTPVFTDTKDFPCCFDAPRREHSRKPDEFYNMIRRVTGGSRIDVFSREPREGFAQYGNENTKFSSNVAAE